MKWDQDSNGDCLRHLTLSLMAESFGLSNTLPTEIAFLVGRKYVFDVSVLCFSFRQENISFQVHKFYLEVSNVFVSLGGETSIFAKSVPGEASA